MASAPPDIPADPPRVSRADVASGAAMTALARAGALIEVVSQPAYVWLFGLSTYGLYVVLWAAVNLLGTILSLSMQQALQRVVPAAKSSEAAHGAVRFALLATVLPSALAALALSVAAPWLAPFFSAAPDIRSHLPAIIALFAWTLPLFVLLEVTTAAVRARRAFGPEIRLRIFWEQLVRLVMAVIAFALGAHFFGLFAAHLVSLALTGLISVRLLGRYYDLGLLFVAPMPRALTRDVLASGLATMPPNLARRAFNDLPPMLLNLTLSGAGGAVAAGLFGIARKVASVPLIVRQAFLYVLAPLSSEQKAHDPAAIAPLYRFSNRLAAAIVLPLSALMIAIGDVILKLFSPEAAAALPVLVILVVGRAGETIFGAATPIVEMTGHRGLPLLNSLLGLAFALLIAWWLVPDLGATGMAWAVTGGVVLASWAAAAELWISDRLAPAEGRFAVACLAGALAWAVLAGVGLAMDEAHWAARAATQLFLFFPLLWLALRVSLDAEDKAALGTVGRRLRL